MDKRVVEELLQMYRIPLNERILEIGCGNGDLVWSLKQKNINITGIDVEFKDGKYTEDLKRSGDILKISTKGDR